MNKRIGVLVAGDQNVNEQSHVAQQVLKDLIKLGHQAVVIPFHSSDDLFAQVKLSRIDAAFLIAEGLPADGHVQGTLELIGIPYTGSAQLGINLSGDKLKAKELFRLHNLETSAYYFLRGEETSLNVQALHEHHGNFGFPVLVKPRHDVGSQALALVRNAEELHTAVAQARRFDSEVLVERHVAGQEIAIALLDGQILGMREVERIEAAELTRPLMVGSVRQRCLVHQASRAIEATEVRGAAVVRMVLSDTMNESILEVDSRPSLAPTAVFSQIAGAAGFDGPAICRAILRDAMNQLANEEAEKLAAGRELARVARLFGADNDKRTPNFATISQA